MSVNQQRSIISSKNKYWIPKYRYLELKNFCLQYNDWKLALNEMSLIKAQFAQEISNSVADPTNTMAEKRMKYERNIELIEKTAKLADPNIAKWIIKGVTENYSYDYLHLKLDLPAGRDMYYDRYRRFFFLLDQKK